MKKKIVIGILITCLIFIFTGCSSWERGIKDFNSNVSGGLKRKVSVYSNDGKLLRTYEGKIDIEVNNDKVKFDLNGKRYIIYNAVVISEEE